eukprot:6208766-Pleurochrysis_carterae.AAC.1
MKGETTTKARPKPLLRTDAGAQMVENRVRTACEVTIHAHADLGFICSPRQSCIRRRTSGALPARCWSARSP